MKRRFLLLFLGFLLCASNTFGQNISNEGTDFWTVFPTHVPAGIAQANIVVFVTSKFNSEVTVSCGSFTLTQKILANTAVPFAVTRGNAYIDFSEQNTVLGNRGIHILVTPGQPKVSAYAHIFAGYRSAASLILPYETLGQNYYSMNYTQIGSGNNFLALVAVEPNTDLLLHKKNGSIVSIKLTAAGDVYEYIDNVNDLTGVFVTTDPKTSSCKKFAAFSGSSALTLGSCATDPKASQDPLYQQLYPTASWGKSYGVVPFKDRRFILRVLAQDDNTKVSVNGQLVATLNKGGFYESAEQTQAVFVTADKLISVAQFALTQRCSAVGGGEIQGDPDMVILNPIEFNIQNITIFSSDKEDIRVKYVNILIKTDKYPSFKINGIKPDVVWQALAGNASYAFAQIEVFDQSLTLSADDGFNAIAYGFGSAESYAYSAGTNLASNNYLSVLNTVSKQTNPDGCVGEESQLNIALPYKAKSISWMLDSASQVNEPSPNLLQTKITSTDTSYIYKSPYKRTFNIAAKHTLLANVIVANAGACLSGNITTNYTFNIYNLPTAHFEIDSTSCANTNVQFTDKSFSNNDGFSVTDWKWDFGDGSDPSDPQSSQQNPQHKFSKEGIYQVKLSVKSTTGCFSNAYSNAVTIYPVPLAKFKSIDKSCINTAVVFTDSSTVSQSLLSGSTIVKWHWDYGDKTSQDYTDDTPRPHIFTQNGSYTVALTVTSNNGCESIAFFKVIEIVDSPIADFTMPDYCISDGAAKFLNTSKNIDGTGAGLTYVWKFNPANPTATSSEKDGEYTFPAAGLYQVMLTITNGQGCEVSTSKTFTVNSDVNTADFTIQNQKDLCSNTDVIINNTSTIDFGKIVKIEVFKDYENNPRELITIPYPTAADIALSYPSFGGNQSKPYTIRLVAYSGQSCFREISKIIILNPSPQLVFNSVPKICIDEGLVSINEAQETSGLLGTGNYSGTGIDSAGNFNAKAAGAGPHEITYTFNGKNGCTQTIKQIVNVYKSPAIILEPKVFVLAGGQLKLPAAAIGDSLTYKWFPTTFLDHDNVLNPTITPSEDTEYTLVVSTTDGCTATAKVFVKVLEGLEVANAFSPNGDGINDVWVIKYLESYPNATVEVFNRQGSRVFFSNGYNRPFDGTFQGSALPVGVYYYIINPRNGRKLVTGPLTIIR